MFVLVAARVETDYGLGDVRARQGSDIAANQCAGIGALSGIGLMPMSTTCQNADRASHVSRATWPRPALGAAPPGELFKLIAGVDLVHVPYRGSFSRTGVIAREKSGTVAAPVENAILVRRAGVVLAEQ